MPCGTLGWLVSATLSWQNKGGTAESWTVSPNEVQTYSLPVARGPWLPMPTCSGSRKCFSWPSRLYGWDSSWTGRPLPWSANSRFPLLACPWERASLRLSRFASQALPSRKSPPFFGHVDTLGLDRWSSSDKKRPPKPVGPSSFCSLVCNYSNVTIQLRFSSHWWGNS